MTDCPPLTSYASALECVLPIVWNAQARGRFSNFKCRRAGAYQRQRAFVCTSTYTDRRTGRTRSYRFVVLAGGLVIRGTWSAWRQA